MGYTIEISYNIHRVETDLYTIIENIAQQYNCLSCYQHYEMSGNMKHEKSDSVITINFEQDALTECSKFVHYVKKIKHVQIETFYTTDNFKLLYASPCYLKSIPHIQSNEYSQNKERRERSWSEGECMVISQIRKDKKRSATLVDENTTCDFSSTDSSKKIT